MLIKVLLPKEFFFIFLLFQTKIALFKTKLFNYLTSTITDRISLKKLFFAKQDIEKIINNL